MSRTIESYIGYDKAGWFVDWSRERRDGHVEFVRWYAGRDGTYADCAARRAQGAPRRGWTRVGASKGAPPHDAATATGMYDREEG